MQAGLVQFDAADTRLATQSRQEAFLRLILRVFTTRVHPGPGYVMSAWRVATVVASIDRDHDTVVVAW